MSNTVSKKEKGVAIDVKGSHNKINVSVGSSAPKAGGSKGGGGRKGGRKSYGGLTSSGASFLNKLGDVLNPRPPSFPMIGPPQTMPMLTNTPNVPTITFPESNLPTPTVSNINSPALQIRASGESSGGSVASTEPPTISSSPIASQPPTRRPSVDLAFEGLNLGALQIPEPQFNLTTEQARELTVKKQGATVQRKNALLGNAKLLGIIAEEGPDVASERFYSSLGNVPFSELESRYETESAKAEKLANKPETEKTMNAFLVADAKREALNKRLLEESANIEREVSGSLEDILGKVVAKEESGMHRERLGMADEEARTRNVDRRMNAREGSNTLPVAEKKPETIDDLMGSLRSSRDEPIFAYKWEHDFGTGNRFYERVDLGNGNYLYDIASGKYLGVYDKNTNKINKDVPEPDESLEPFVPEKPVKRRVLPYALRREEGGKAQTSTTNYLEEYNRLENEMLEAVRTGTKTEAINASERFNDFTERRKPTLINNGIDKAFAPDYRGVYISYPSNFELMSRRSGERFLKELKARGWDKIAYDNDFTVNEERRKRYETQPTIDIIHAWYSRQPLYTPPWRRNSQGYNQYGVIPLGQEWFT